MISYLNKNIEGAKQIILKMSKKSKWAEAKVSQNNKIIQQKLKETEYFFPKLMSGNTEYLVIILLLVVMLLLLLLLSIISLIHTS